MHKRFGNRLRDQLAQLGKTQKDLAAEVHTSIESPDEVAFNTLPPKLSKLLAGHREGVDFFRNPDAPHRWRALATSLALSEMELERAWEQCEKCVSLVLDPRLPDEATKFFQAQASASDAGFAVVPVRNEHEDARAAIREAAEAADKPVLVALAETTDAEFFRGADINWSAVRRVPRGFCLTENPDLVPIPPQREPALFSEGGEPLRPVADSEEVNRGHAFYPDHIAAARDIGELLGLIRFRRRFSYAANASARSQYALS